MYSKSLNDDPEFWGIKSEMSPSVISIYFEKLLKKCGRFLTHLVLDNCAMVKSNIVNLLIRECPNLQDINFNDHDIHDDNINYFIEDIKPVFHKVKNFHCGFDYKVTDEDLKKLFSINDKLEYLNLRLTEDIYTFTFLDALPNETIRELIVNSDIPLHRIVYVSLFMFKF